MHDILVVTAKFEQIRFMMKSTRDSNDKWSISYEIIYREMCHRRCSRARSMRLVYHFDVHHTIHFKRSGVRQRHKIQSKYMATAAAASITSMYTDVYPCATVMITKILSQKRKRQSEIN